MKLRQLEVCVSFGLAAVLFGGVASSADKPSAADTASVLSKLHHSNQMEVAAGKLAQEKGQSKDVKSFGKMLVTDHSAADKKVTQLAKDEKIDLAEAPMPADKMDKLKSASSAEFDKMFASEMLDDHKKDIAEVKEARDGTPDAKLKKLLAAVLPTLEKHRDTAQKLVDKLGPSASATGAGVTPTATK